jgi:hypothetical protein
VAAEAVPLITGMPRRSQAVAGDRRANTRGTRTPPGPRARAHAARTETSRGPSTGTASAQQLRSSGKCSSTHCRRTSWPGDAASVAENEEPRSGAEPARASIAHAPGAAPTRGERSLKGPTGAADPSQQRSHCIAIGTPLPLGHGAAPPRRARGRRLPRCGGQRLALLHPSPHRLRMKARVTRSWSSCRSR